MDHFPSPDYYQGRRHQLGLDEQQRETTDTQRELECMETQVRSLEDAAKRLSVAAPAAFTTPQREQFARLMQRLTTLATNPTP